MSSGLAFHKLNVGAFHYGGFASLHCSLNSLNGLLNLYLSQMIDIKTGLRIIAPFWVTPGIVVFKRLLGVLNTTY